jgi:hypothetical protein
LRAKRDELDRIITSYEGALAAATRDFANVNAALELFETDSVPAASPSRLSIVRMFKRGEIFDLCKIALAQATAGLDTRELARALILAKGMDENDSVLRPLLLRQNSKPRAATIYEYDPIIEVSTAKSPAIFGFPGPSLNVIVLAVHAIPGVGRCFGRIHRDMS